MTIEPLGDSAVLVRVASEFHPDETPDAVLRALQQLQQAAIPAVIDLAPAYTTIGIFLDAGGGDFDTVRRQVEEALEKDLAPARRPAARQAVEVPVCYEDEFAADLADVAQHARLSAKEVVARHCAATYRVACVGFTPGFPYLTGLPAELATPRRPSPRKEIPAGAVAIGGTQTGIYPTKSPGGWNIIGRTPLRLFDVGREPPALLQTGDRVHLRRISRQEFDALSR